MKRIKVIFIALTGTVLASACSRPGIVKEVAVLTSGHVAAVNVAALNELTFLSNKRGEIDKEVNQLGEMTKFYQFKVNEVVGDWKATDDQTNLRTLDSLREGDVQTIKDLELMLNPPEPPKTKTVKGLTQLEKVLGGLDVFTRDRPLNVKEFYSFAKDVKDEFKKLQEEAKNETKK